MFRRAGAQCPGTRRADCRAPSLTIEHGARIEGSRFRVPALPEFRKP